MFISEVVMFVVVGHFLYHLDCSLLPQCIFNTTCQLKEEEVNK